MRLPCLLWVCAALAACNTIPDEVRQVLDRHHESVRTLARQEAERCPKYEELARQNKGNVPTSLAVGSALDKSDDVLQVEVTCFRAEGGGFTGDGFMPLRKLPARKGGSMEHKTYKLQQEPRREETVLIPSGRVDGPDTFDLIVQAPSSGTGYAQVQVAFRAGAKP